MASVIYPQQHQNGAPANPAARTNGAANTHPATRTNGAAPANPAARTNGAAPVTSTHPLKNPATASSTAYQVGSSGTGHPATAAPTAYPTGTTAPVHPATPYPTTAAPTAYPTGSVGGVPHPATVSSTITPVAGSGGVPNPTVTRASVANIRSTDALASTMPPGSFRCLNYDEWTRFCRGVGAIDDGEEKSIAHPTSWLWPPKGLPDGLYRDIIYQKTIYAYSYSITSFLRWVLMVIQLLLGAVLTALGALSSKDGTAITVIAAINTCIAGLLALLHNSGLPDRYQSDSIEFYSVELYVREIIESSLVSTHDNLNDVLARCFAKFQEAKQTVQNNNPTTYAAAVPNGPTSVKPATQTQPPPAVKQA